MNIDTSIVYGNYVNITSSVTYYLYEHKSPVVTIPIHPEKLANPVVRACFVDLNSQLRENSRLNRIAYLPRLLFPKLLPREVAKKWIRIAKKAKLLPEYVRPIHMDNTFVLDLSTIKNHVNLMYIYLANLRFIEEEPHFVRSVVHLVRHHKMDTYAAVAFAAALATNHSGHGYLMVRPYYSTITANGLKVPINWAIGLRRFIHNPEKYNRKNSHFNCTNTIREISSVTTQLSIQDYTKPEVIRAIYSETDQEAKEHLASAGIKNSSP
jgi:hypothetical protein